MPTISELVTLVRDALDEPSAAQWSDATLRKWLNEANRDLARFTRHLRDKASVTTVAGTAEYTLPANILSVELAWYDDGDRQIPLSAKHYENMDSAWGMYQDRESTPALFTTYGFSPAVKLQLYPVPVVSGDAVKLLVARLPTAIPESGSDSSAVETVDSWFDALVDYCEYKALRRDRDPRWQESRQLYIEKRQDLVNMPDYIVANRELVPDANAGYLPRWLVEGDGSW